jgi:hypothetical protein
MHSALRSTMIPTQLMAKTDRVGIAEATAQLQRLDPTTLPKQLEELLTSGNRQVFAAISMLLGQLPNEQNDAATRRVVASGYIDELLERHKVAPDSNLGKVGLHIGEVLAGLGGQATARVESYGLGPDYHSLAFTSSTGKVHISLSNTGEDQIARVAWGNGALDSALISKQDGRKFWEMLNELRGVSEGATTNSFMHALGKVAL